VSGQKLSEYNSYETLVIADIGTTWCFFKN